MVEGDGKGQYRSYLSSDDNFTVVRDLHKKNLLVPVVGNFAGPKALRAVARYLKEREATVSAFYLSNVEQYLSREGTVVHLLRKCRDAAARRVELLHSVGPRRHGRARHRPRLAARQHARAGERVRGALEPRITTAQHGSGSCGTSSVSTARPALLPGA